MALYVGSTLIPETLGKIKVGDTNVRAVAVGNVIVWSAVISNSSTALCSNPEDCLYQIDDNAATIPSNGIAQFGNVQGSCALFKFNMLTPNYAKDPKFEYVPGSATIKGYFNVPVETTPGSTSYLTTGQPLNQSGLTTVYRASPTIYYPFTFPVSAYETISTYTIPDDLFNEFIAADNRTIGMAVTYNNAWVKISGNNTIRILASFRRIAV